ncbi:hypothetical protein, partial [Taibaiella chishuiensis]|uniref:hypothetical protein n=1 Tax=Taibaiella chishuiensis TaxID=1434707 RepID=UPI001C6301EE
WLSVNFDFFIASTLKLVFLSTFKHYGFKGSLQKYKRKRRHCKNCGHRDQVLSFLRRRIGKANQEK